MSLITNHKLGADIELFLMDEKTKEIISAEGFIKGTKEHPYTLDVNNPYYSSSLDNVMAEFTIMPANTPYEFYKNVQRGLRYIEQELPKGIKPIALPAAFLHESFLQTENAKLFGCIPDYNAWTERENDMPYATETTLRSAGGHIHIGYDNPSEFTNLMIVKAMDLYVGVPSVIIEPENKRKELYGKAGAFRHKPYGVEYRSVSNFYVTNQHLTEYIASQTEEAINFVNRGELFNLDEEDVYRIQDAINNNNKRKARHLIKKFGLKIA